MGVASRPRHRGRAGPRRGHRLPGRGDPQPRAPAPCSSCCASCRASTSPSTTWAARGSRCAASRRRRPAAARRTCWSSTTACASTRTSAGGATVVNLDIPLDHVRQVEVLRGPAAAGLRRRRPGGGGEPRQPDHRGLPGHGGRTSASARSAPSSYGLRSGGVLGAVRDLGLHSLRASPTARAGTCPRTPRPAPTAIAWPPTCLPISVAPGTATDDLRALDAAYAFALREWTFSFRTKSERSDGLHRRRRQPGPADPAQHEPARRRGQLEPAPREPRDPRACARASCGARLSDLLEIYPSGYQLEGDFGTHDLRQARRRGGRVPADRVQLAPLRRSGHRWRRDLTRAATSSRVASAFVTTRPTTSQANANLDLRTLTPVDPPWRERRSCPSTDAVADTSRTTFESLRRRRVDGEPRLTVTGGLRFDHLSDLGGTLNPRLALVGALPRGLRLQAALRPRVSRPDLARARPSTSPAALANPDLRLVKADELELAVLLHPQPAPPRGTSLPRTILRDTDRAARPARPGRHLDLRQRERSARSAGFELVAQRQLRRLELLLRELHLPGPEGPGDGASRCPGLPRSLLRRLAANLDIRGARDRDPERRGAIGDGRARPGDLRARRPRLRHLQRHRPREEPLADPGGGPLRRQPVRQGLRGSLVPGRRPRGLPAPRATRARSMPASSSRSA